MLALYLLIRKPRIFFLAYRKVFIPTVAYGLLNNFRPFPRSVLRPKIFSGNTAFMAVPSIASLVLLLGRQVRYVQFYAV